jgi:hypothetical protein
MLSPLAAPIGKDGMVTLAHFIMWFLLAWLAGLAAVVLLRSLGQGQLRELLHTTKPDGGTGDAIDPGFIWSCRSKAATSSTFRKAFLWGNCPEDKKNKFSGAVPGGFYKIVHDPTRRRVLAFALPNRRLSGRRMGEFRTTVREIEELTGLNFFPLLKRRTQNILEMHEGGMWRW